MKKPYLILNTKEVAEYIKSKINIEDLLCGKKILISNKLHELSAALVLARFHLKQTGEHSNILLSLRTKPKEPKSIKEIIESDIDENDLNDIQFVNAEVPLKEMPVGKIKGWAVQIKRFDLGAIDSTELLCKYLTGERIAGHYVSNNASLVLLLENKGKLNVEVVNKVISQIEKFPFPNIFYISVHDDAQVTIGELWPQNGRTTYSKKEWFSSALIGEEGKDGIY